MRKMALSNKMGNGRLAFMRSKLYRNVHDLLFQIYRYEKFRTLHLVKCTKKRENKYTAFLCSIILF